MTYYGVNYDSSLEHHGMKNQKWGRRQYQNKDGSLTPLGYEHYGVHPREKRSGENYSKGDKYRTNVSNRQSHSNNNKNNSKPKVEKAPEQKKSRATRAIEKTRSAIVSGAKNVGFAVSLTGATNRQQWEKERKEKNIANRIQKNFSLDDRTNARKNTLEYATNDDIDRMIERARKENQYYNAVLEFEKARGEYNREWAKNNKKKDGAFKKLGKTFLEKGVPAIGNKALDLGSKYISKQIEKKFESSYSKKLTQARKAELDAYIGAFKTMTNDDLMSWRKMGGINEFKSNGGNENKKKREKTEQKQQQSVKPQQVIDPIRNRYLNPQNNDKPKAEVKTKKEKKFRFKRAKHDAMSYGTYFDVNSRNDSYLKHHGVEGQEWGKRQYQYENGSLTPLGYEHYGVHPREKRSEKTDPYTKNLSKAMPKQLAKDASKATDSLIKGDLKGVNDATSSAKKQILKKMSPETEKMTKDIIKAISTGIKTTTAAVALVSGNPLIAKGGLWMSTMLTASIGGYEMMSSINKGRKYLQQNKSSPRSK